MRGAGSLRERWNCLTLRQDVGRSERGNLVYFVDALKVIARRWYVCLAGVIILACATGVVIKVVPTQYQASGQLLLLLPSEASGTKTPTNPYLNLQSGLTTTASLISTAVSGKDAQRQLAKEGLASEYSLSLIPGTGPLILITATDSDPTTAIRTRDYLIKRLDGQLQDLQDRVNVPQRQLISSLPTNVDSQAEVLPGSKLRALGAIGGTIIVLTLIVTFTLDRFLLVRRAGMARTVSPNTRRFGRGLVRDRAMQKPVGDHARRPDAGGRPREPLLDDGAPAEEVDPREDPSSTSDDLRDHGVVASEQGAGSRRHTQR